MRQDAFRGLRDRSADPGRGARRRKLAPAHLWTGSGGSVQGSQLELYLLRVLAERIFADSRSGDLWRQMRRAAAVTIALESAKHTGGRAGTVAIAFGLSESGAARDFFPISPGITGR